MTDIIAKPFDWNDSLSKEALEDFEGIRKDLPYCICQNIGMALAKLELLEKQGCKVIDPSGSSSEKPNKCDDAISRQAVLDVTWEEPSYTDALNVLTEVRDKVKALPPVNQFKPINCPSMGIDCEDCPAYEDAISRKEAISIAGIATLSVNQVVTALKKLPPVNPQKPKSECEHDHEILKAYSDGANAVLDKIRAEIEEEYNRLSATRADETLELGECLGLKMSLKIIDKYIEEGKA